MLPLRWSYLSLFSAISFLCLKARSQSSNVRWWILTDISTQIRVQLLNCRCSRQNYALHQFCIFTKVSEAQFISVRFPTVGIPLMSISAEHRIPEISKLRIALMEMVSMPCQDRFLHPMLIQLLRKEIKGRQPNGARQKIKTLTMFISTLISKSRTSTKKLGCFLNKIIKFYSHYLAFELYFMTQVFNR